MRNSILKLFGSARTKALLALATVSSSPLFAAADDMGSQVINGATKALQGIVDDVVKLLQVVMGLGAIVALAIVIFQVFQGEREAAKKLAWWVAGLTIGFVLLTVVSNLIR